MHESSLSEVISTLLVPEVKHFTGPAFRVLKSDRVLLTPNSMVFGPIRKCIDLTQQKPKRKNYLARLSGWEFQISWGSFMI